MPVNLGPLSRVVAINGTGNRLYTTSGFPPYTGTEFVGFVMDPKTKGHPVIPARLPPLFINLGFNKQLSGIPAIKKMGVFKSLLKAKSSLNAQFMGQSALVGSRFQFVISAGDSGGYLPTHTWREGDGTFFSILQAREITEQPDPKKPPKTDWLLLLSCSLHEDIQAQSRQFFRQVYLNGVQQGGNIATTPFLEWNVLVRLSELERAAGGTQRNAEGYTTINVIEHFVPFFKLAGVFGVYAPGPGTVMISDVDTSTTTGSQGGPFPALNNLTSTTSHTHNGVMETNSIFQGEDLWGVLKQYNLTVSQVVSSLGANNYVVLNGNGTAEGTITVSQSNVLNGSVFEYSRSLTLGGVVVAAHNVTAFRDLTVNSHSRAQSIFVGGQGGAVSFSEYNVSANWAAFEMNHVMPWRGENLALEVTFSSGGGMVDTNPNAPGVVSTLNEVTSSRVLDESNYKYSTNPDLALSLLDDNVLVGRASFPTVVGAGLVNGVAVNAGSSFSSFTTMHPLGPSPPPGVIQDTESDSTQNTSDSIRQISFSNATFMDYPENSAQVDSHMGFCVVWPRPVEGNINDGVCYARVSDVDAWNTFRGQLAQIGVNNIQQQIDALQAQINQFNAILNSPALLQQFAELLQITVQELIDLLNQLIANFQAQIDALIPQLPPPGQDNSEQEKAIEDQMEPLLTIRVNNFASRKLLYRLVPGQSYIIVGPLPATEVVPWVPPPGGGGGGEGPPP